MIITFNKLLHSCFVSYVQYIYSLNLTYDDEYHDYAYDEYDDETDVIFTIFKIIIEIYLNNNNSPSLLITDHLHKKYITLNLKNKLVRQS